jgi:hypothetical protein
MESQWGLWPAGLGPRAWGALLTLTLTQFRSGANTGVWAECMWSSGCLGGPEKWGGVMGAFRPWFS